MTTATAPAIKFSEVLIATEFSDVSDNALAYAKSLARTFESRLLLVHVADPIAHIAIPQGGWADDPARITKEVETTQSAEPVFDQRGSRHRNSVRSAEWRMKSVTWLVNVALI